MIYTIGQKLYGIRFDDFTVVELTIRDVGPAKVKLDWAASEYEDEFCPETGRSCYFKFISDDPQKAEARANTLMLEALEDTLRHRREEAQKAIQKVDEMNERIRKFKKRKKL